MSSENITLFIKKEKLSGTIQLTGSKSESNRALIMQALSMGKVKVENLSKAADTVTLENILRSEIRNPKSEINVGPAGTAMRFLTAFATLQQGEITLTGTERMKQRPIGILTDALKALGAQIQFTENEGFPPVKLTGPLQQKTNRIIIKGNVSSQYISALLLIAANLPQGLNVTIEGELTSKPYVEMTLTMLDQAGIKHTWNENTISIQHQEFNHAVIPVEPDWSAASYWYAIAALAPEAELFLPGLNAYSLQGDSQIAEIMANFGVTSQFKNGGVLITKEAKDVTRKIFDFKECPDLAQTVIVVCAALGHDATFTGLETLKIKETDRVKALQNELEKIGVKLIEKNFTYKLDCSGLNFPNELVVETYEDHRMAMAFAPLALVINKVQIEDQKVVEKSYPHFWEDLKKAGFEIN
ncbi:MAG TPA: 3-phosphoshikimate 1-carboxyvinyltransferase [Sphingobacteriaceae bacterium]|nr:3-phosphoshikimate 1-carboxyvinyltransferase [Sphingobacteriaceae bacterium]